MSLSPTTWWRRGRLGPAGGPRCPASATVQSARCDIKRLPSFTDNKDDNCDDNTVQLLPQSKVPGVISNVSLLSLIMRTITVKIIVVFTQCTFFTRVHSFLQKTKINIGIDTVYFVKTISFFFQHSDNHIIS